MSIVFTKMSGCGNDFIIIDNRQSVIKNSEKIDFVTKICVPKVSVGADGVIFIEKSDKTDFKWDFYNADGSSAEMCGNGARCVAHYAFLRKIAEKKMSFETTAGIITAEIKENSVRIRLTMPNSLQRNQRENDCCNPKPQNTIKYYYKSF